MAKEFLVDVKRRFVKNEKAEIDTFLTTLISIRYKGKDKGKERKMDKNIVNTTPQEKRQKKLDNPKRY